MDTTKTVILRRFTSIGEAYIYESLLKANNIDCSLIHATATGVLGIQNEMLTVDLCIMESDLERAEQILNASFEK